MHRAFALAVILLAASLSGCTLFGDEGSAEATSGPRAQIVLDNDAKYRVTLRYTLTDPAGGMAGTGVIEAAPGEDAEAIIPLNATGAHALKLTYQWDANGRAAGGSSDLAFDSRDCHGATRIVYHVSQDDNGGTFGGSAVTCQN